MENNKLNDDVRKSDLLTNTSYEISERLSDKVAISQIEYDIYACKKWVSLDDLRKRIITLKKQYEPVTMENKGIILDIILSELEDANK